MCTVLKCVITSFTIYLSLCIRVIKHLDLCKSKRLPEPLYVLLKIYINPNFRFLVQTNIYKYISIQMRIYIVVCQLYKQHMVDLELILYRRDLLKIYVDIATSCFLISMSCGWWLIKWYISSLLIIYFFSITVRKPKDCSDLDPKHDHSGVYRIYPTAGRGFKVYCDMTTDGGRWTVSLILSMKLCQNWH